MGLIKEAILVYILILVGVFYYKPELIQANSELSQYKFLLPTVIVIAAVLAYYIVSFKSMVHFGPPM